MNDFSDKELAIFKMGLERGFAQGVRFYNSLTVEERDVFTSTLAEKSASDEAVLNLLTRSELRKARGK